MQYYATAQERNKQACAHSPRYVAYLYPLLNYCNFVPVSLKKLNLNFVLRVRFWSNQNLERFNFIPQCANFTFKSDGFCINYFLSPSISAKRLFFSVSKAFILSIVFFRLLTVGFLLGA